MKLAMKLHKQFSHFHKIQQLVIDGGTTDKQLLDMIEKVEQSCETCLKYKKLFHCHYPKNSTGLLQSI